MSPSPPESPEPASGRLDSWKEIAAYLGTTVRTAQRWEKAEGLPVERHLHAERHSVYAFRETLDRWRAGRSPAPQGTWPARLPVVRGPALAAGAAVVLAVLTAAWWQTRPTARAPMVETVPLTAYHGHEIHPSLSPDGRRVAFAWDGGERGRYDIYVKAIDGSDAPIRLTTDPRADIGPAWSPDGRRLAFLRRLPGADAVVLITPGSAAPERLVATLVLPDLAAWGPTGSGHPLTWLPDGRSLVTAVAGARTGPARLAELSIETGVVRPLTDPDPRLLGDVAPALSPDGRTLAFSRFRNARQGDLFLLDVRVPAGPQANPRRLTALDRLVFSPAWTSDGASIAFTAGTAPADMRLWQVAAAGGDAAPVAGADGPVNLVAHGGGRWVISRGVGDIDIWTQEWPAPQEGAVPAAGPPVRLIASSRPEGGAQFSPHGDRIAFVSLRSGRRALYVTDRGGTDTRPLPSLPGHDVVNAGWSSEGSRLAVTTQANGSSHISTIDARGGPPRLVYSDAALVTDSAADRPRWSHDDRWIYVASRRSGAMEIWKAPSDGGAAVQVTRGGGSAPAESVDGRRVHFVRRPARSIWSVPVDGGGERHVANLPGGLYELVEGGAYVLERRGHSGEATLSFLDFATGRVMDVARVHVPEVNEFTVAPDARALLYARPEARGTDLLLARGVPDAAPGR